MPNYCSIITYHTVLKWMNKNKTQTTPSPNANRATTVAITGTN